MAFVYRSDMHAITASIQGVSLPKGFFWDSLEGGDGAQSNEYYFAGNMQPAVPTGGLWTPTDVTITVAWRNDVYPYYKPLVKASKFGNTVTVSAVPLKPDSTTAASPFTLTGILLSAVRPQLEASASSIGYLTCTIAANAGIN